MKSEMAAKGAATFSPLNSSGSTVYANVPPESFLSMNEMSLKCNETSAIAVCVMRNWSTESNPASMSVVSSTTTRFRWSAEAGFASAMCSLGRCLFAGNGVAKDRDEKGVELVRTNPNNTALNELVLHHEDGLPSQIDCPVLFVLIGPF